MSLHVIFVNDDFDVISDVTSGFTSVTIPANALIMRICDDTKSYSNSTLTKLFEIDELYTKVLEYTTKGDFPYIDINVQNYNNNHTAIFNQLSAQFVGNLPPIDIYDFSEYGSGGGSSVDLSGIETALTNINTVLSGFTSLLSNLSNLSNLTQLANIITAIQNKDNQSDIVDELSFIFTESYENRRYSCLKPDLNVLSSIVPSANRSRYTFSGIFCRLMSLLSSNKRDLSSYFSEFSNTTFRSNNQSLFESSSKTSFQNLQDISVKLQDIETKLEQNLPFTTIVENDIVETNVAQNCSYGSKIEQIPFLE